MVAGSPYVENGKPVVRPSFCFFVDLLGFSSRILECKSPVQSNMLLANLDAVIQEQKETWALSGSTWQYRLFSDCLVFANPVTDRQALGEPELGRCFEELAWYQLQMLHAGFVVRGAIAFGEMHISEDLCFGKALVEAYRLENKDAKYPRVILSDHVRLLVEKHMSWYANPASAPQAHSLLRDIEDDRFFVNYLEATNYTGEGPDWDVLTRHRDLIVSNLRRFRGSDGIKPKYEWLRDYHNYFCASDRVYYTEEWEPPPDGVESLLINQATEHGGTHRFSQIAEGNGHKLSLKARFPLLPPASDEK
jgi:hypothetical protein